MLTTLAASAQIYLGVGPNGYIYGDGSGLTNIPASAVIASPTIATFVNNQNSVEQGATVASVQLDWTLSGGAITNQSLNQGIGSINLTNRTYTDTNAFTTNRTYTLTTTDGTTTPTANTSITFYQRAYWGATNLTSLNNAEILTLTNAFATSRVMTKTISTADNYPYFVWPETFGVGTFTVGGLPDIGWTVTTNAAFTNASGYVSSYIVTRHTLALPVGTYVVEVN